MTSLSPDPPIPLWLDCDPGHDDAFAILLATAHPRLKLLGISTVHGNASLEHTTDNALRILTLLDRNDIPVYAGAAKPFCRPAVHASNIHGKSGLDGTTLLPEAEKGPVENGNAVVAMRDAIMACERGTAWIVATGALTNVALAFATFPELAGHLRGLSIMGGAVGGGFADVMRESNKDGSERCGNVTKWAEFNIYCDPEAAKSIFTNLNLAKKTTLIPLDVTHQVLADYSVQQELLQVDHGTASKARVPKYELRKAFCDLLGFFGDRYRNVAGLASGPPLHDPVAVAALLPHEEVSFDDRGGERWRVDVVTDGPHETKTSTNETGRTVVTKVNTEGVRIPGGLDIKHFWQLVQDAMSVSEERLMQADVRS